MKRYGEPIPQQSSSEAPQNNREQAVDVMFGGCGYGAGKFRRHVPPPRPSLFARLLRFLGLAREKAPEEDA